MCVGFLSFMAHANSEGLLSLVASLQPRINKGGDSKTSAGKALLESHYKGFNCLSVSKCSSWQSSGLCGGFSPPIDEMGCIDLFQLGVQNQLWARDCFAHVSRGLALQH